MSANFKTPVLFLIFNRPDTAQRVFNEIKRHKPMRLFVAADGPRKGVQGEEQKCLEAREIIKQVDWDCELKILFREENLGCGRAISGAIDWFFSQVEEGIILEDDCVPNTSFFEFMSKALEMYRDDKRVFMISGSNSMHPKTKLTCSDHYFFSRYCNVWGWGAWRRTLENYDYSMKSWPKIRSLAALNKLFHSIHISNWFIFILDKAYFGKIDTWDIQLQYACIIQKGLVLTSIKNLVSNIGNIGTHTEKCLSNVGALTVSETMDQGQGLKKKEVILDVDMTKIQFSYVGANHLVLKYWMKNLINGFKFGYFR